MTTARAAVAATRRLAGATVGRVVSLLLLGLVHGYRRFVSPLLGPRCRFYPSCSAYALEAIRVHGAAKGTVLATARVCRCHPWNPGGVDHVPARGAWRPEPYVPLTRFDEPAAPAAQPPLTRTTPSDAPASGRDDRSVSWT